eukprot:CAMPEP_0184858882 /NCGR_PEP_ID=MMETSP0580-20130426/3911_1 /TAXON_ID=1118495 /ORGANISM="Dactyliosolen fragilissimus" /LENGTH=235 /DNA_ID=CAMNT_0027355223 /DNA_START=340 /DNA_END=1047 /DNA_ORIENTATION=+
MLPLKLKSGVPNYFESSTHFTYRRIPVYDAATSDLLSVADSIVAFISGALHHGSVLVHCQRGISRSSTCVIFFLMKKVSMPLDEALSLCRKRRTNVFVEPIPAFMKQLRMYEKKCVDLGFIGKKSVTKKSNRCIGDGAKPRKICGPSIGPLLPQESCTGHNKKQDGKKVKVASKKIDPCENKRKGQEQNDNISVQKKMKQDVIGPTLPDIMNFSSRRTADELDDSPNEIGPSLPP